MKRRTIFAAFVILPVLFCTFGCGGKSELSRDKAARILQASSKFTPASDLSEWKPDALKIEMQDGLVAIRIGVPSITEKGLRYLHFHGDMQETNPIMPRKIIEVTGIADGPATEGAPGTVKAVQFTWKWDRDKSDNELKKIVDFEKLCNGNALFKLYDDGWRVERVENPDPYKQ